MVVIHTHAKDEGQRSVGLKEGVEMDGRTDGQTEATALPLMLTWSIIMLSVSRT